MPQQTDTFYKEITICNVLFYNNKGTGVFKLTKFVNILICDVEFSDQLKLTVFSQTSAANMGEQGLRCFLCSVILNQCHLTM